MINSRRRMIFGGLFLLGLVVTVTGIIPGIEIFLFKFPGPTENIPQTAFMRYRDEAPNSPWIDLDAISPELVCSVVKAEDSTFFHHAGFEWRQIRKAVKRLFSGEKRIGASTLSQQVARNLFLTPDRTWLRKLREVVYTGWLELRFSKPEILAIYLNTIEWGPGIWGVAAASKAYFGENPRAIHLSQALLLSGLIASPKKPATEQLDRLRNVSLRIAYQLHDSEYLSESSVKAAEANFESFAATKSFASLRKIEPTFLPRHSVLLAQGCGSQREYVNNLLAQEGLLLSNNESFIIKKALLSENPTVAGISPDGNVLLLRSANEHDFSLSAMRRTGGDILAIDHSRSPHRLPVWNSESTAIAFSLSEERPDRHRVCVLPIGRERHCFSTTESSSPPLIRWSPDGKRIAFLRTPPNRTEKFIVILPSDPSEWRKETTNETESTLSANASFDWASDSQTLAAIAEDDPSTLKIFDSNGRNLPSLRVVPGDCRSVDRGKEGEFLVGCRKTGRRHGDLFLVNPRTAKISRIASAPGEIVSAMALRNRDSVAYHVNEDHEYRIRIVQGSADRAIGPEEGHNLLTAPSPDGKSLYVLHTSRTKPAELLEIDLSTQKHSLVRRTLADPDIHPVKPRRIDFADTSAPAFLWEARAGKEKRAAVVFVPGKGTETVPHWNPLIQAIVSRGIHVFALSDNTPKALRSAIETMEKRFHTLPEKTIVIGQDRREDRPMVIQGAVEFHFVPDKAKRLEQVASQARFYGGAIRKLAK